MKAKMPKLATSFLILFACASVLVTTSQAAAAAADHSAFLRCLACRSTTSDQHRRRVLKHIHRPTSPAYNSLLRQMSRNARWSNSTAESQPFLIFAPNEEAEIRPIIQCSKEFDFHLRICSGGHDYEGLSFHSPTKTTKFIMLALTNLNRADINIEEETAWIQSGVSLGQLYYEIAKKSQIHAFPGGLYPTVGAGGHISGGGLGTLVRKYGLAADNVLDARVMNSNGEILDRKSMGEDLFWAIRGGGGSSFCIVLAWKLRLVRVPANVTAFTFRRRLDSGDDMGLLQRWQKVAHRLSDDLFMRVLVQNVAGGGGKKNVHVTYNGLFLGPAFEFVPELYKSFPEFGLKVEDCFKPPAENYSCPEMPCIKTICHQLPWINSVMFFIGKMDQPLEILLNKTTRQGYNKATSDFLTEPIPDKGWEMIKDKFMSEELPMMIVDPFGGKMDEISAEETPFPHRKGTNFIVQYLTNWAAENNEKDEGRHLAWIRDLYDEMKPYVADNPRSAYLNYRDLDLGRNDANYSYDNARVWGEKYFKGNFERLAKVKGSVDPGNFFRFEQSVPVFL